MYIRVCVCIKFCPYPADKLPLSEIPKSLHRPFPLGNVILMKPP